MIQDIEPKVFNNSFKSKRAESEDQFLSYKGDTVLIREDKGSLWYPSFSDFEIEFPHPRENAQYLFSSTANPTISTWVIVAVHMKCWRYLELE